ncbi:MAG: prepilin-type N-terminal cleavage/methylation domain-containing protein [Lentisphaeria bacterium]|nr:prepilin-type N-terminal cleavage/methylation domain-containing protein [Lentisphaeria bacterium]
MKTSSKRFTLIELLVVIAIIAILAGLVFPALGVVRNNAKKSKANSECQSMKTAIIMYESEFSCWPANVSGSTDALVSSSEYIQMCKRLTGENSKKTVFYEVGVGYDENKGILDPWGRPYQVILDVDFDGKIKAVDAVEAVNKVNNRTGQDLRTKVAVYAYGVVEKDKDAKDLDKLASTKKLVISW